MRLKLDENLGNRGHSILQAAGHDVFTVALQQLCGATDQELIEKCRREDRALVSLDLDFANPLRFQPSQYPGIAVAPPQISASKRKALSTHCACSTGLPS